MNKAVRLTTPAHSALPLIQVVTNALASAGASPSLSPGNLIRLGSVWVGDHRVQHPDSLSPPLSPIRIFPRPKLFPVFDEIGTSQPDWASRLLPLSPEASRHFVAVDKPGGVPVHETTSNAVQCTLAGVRRALADNNLHVTTRLDVGTHGVLFFARSAAALACFNRLIRNRAVTKLYRALLTGPPPSLGRISHVMSRDKRRPKYLLPSPPPQSPPPDNGRSVSLRILSLSRVYPSQLASAALHAYALQRHCAIAGGSAAVAWPAAEQQQFHAADVELETGATHQIRVQMAAVGATVVGCSEYSHFPPWITPNFGENVIPEATRKMLDVNDLNGALCLECRRISFDAPDCLPQQRDEQHSEGGREWSAELLRNPWWLK